MESLLDLDAVGSGPGPGPGQAIDVILKTILVLTAAALSCLALPRASASTRHLIWALAVTGAGAIPFLTLALPAWRLPVLPAAWPGKTLAVGVKPSSPLPVAAMPPRGPDIERPVGDPTIDPGRPDVRPGRRTAASPRSTSLPATTPSPGSWAWWIASAWFLGAVVVMAPVLVGQAGLRLLRRRSLRLAAGPWAELSEQLRSRLGISRCVVLLRGGVTASPMSWGVFRPTILLPAAAEDWPSDRLRNVNLQELAHVKRWGSWSVVGPHRRGWWTSKTGPPKRGC